MDSRVAVAILLAVAVAGVGFATAVPDAQLTVGDVDVDPETPVAGEPVTLSPTIESSAGSDEAVEITSVTATVDGEELDTKENVGTLSPGDDVTVPVTTTFEDPGQYTVTFTIEGEDEDGDGVTVTREETIVVSPVADVRLTIDDVEIQPETPTAGAPVTVPVSVASSGGSNQPVEADQVRLQDGSETLVAAEDLGALAVGDGITVPLTTTFENPGTKNLTVVFEGTNANDEQVSARLPVTIPVEPGAPAIETRGPPAVEGVTTNVEVFVANPTEAALRNVAVTVDGEGIDPIIDRRVVPALQAGTSANLSFDIRPAIAGETVLQTNVTYTTVAGTTAEVQETEPVTIVPREEAVSVRVDTVDPQPESNQPALDAAGVEGFLDTGGDQQEQEGSEGDLRVTVSNVGNAPLNDVVLHPQAAEESLGARPVTDRLPPNSEESVTVSIERTPPAEIVFEAAYTVAGERSNAQASFDPLPDRGRVAVTGVDVEADGDTFEITGDIGNPGEGEVSGVVVSVAETEHVTPALGGQDFFVGAIEGDSFAPFELTATVDENATTVPLEVEYLVAGDQRTETVEVPVESVSRNSESDGPSLLLIGGIVVLLVVLVAVTIGLARRT